jgi:F-type H+-transporting ATPase subunit b
MITAQTPHSTDTAPIAAHTEAHGGEDHGPTLLGLSAEGWVYTGVTIFFLIAFFYVKAHKIIAAGLDAKIADTRKALDDAANLRSEAEALLNDAKKKHSAAALDAKAMLAAAENEAGQVVAKAEADAKLLIERRQKMAEDNIAAAERGAIAEVRAKAAAIAASAASNLIGQNHNAKADAKLIDAAISQLN